MKILILIFILPIISFDIYSQNIIDTVYQSDTMVYYCINNQEISVLTWQITGGEILSENPSQTDSVIIQFPDNEGIYTISVSEQTTNGCLGQIFTADVLVIEKPEPPIPPTTLIVEIPNIFTPNGDGINDFFKVKFSENVDIYTITITNRSGKKVFESTNFNNSWNGYYNNTLCSDGVYYYLINYKFGNEVKTLNGFFQIVSNK